MPVLPAEPVPLQGPPQLARVALPAGVITKLPGRRPLLAWTVDDGMDADVVGKYIEFAAATGTRLTLFINGAYPAWTKHAALLRPLGASGQIQLGNHSWDHPNLTKLSDSRVVAELQRNHDFITSTYDVDARPYFRPPYGFRHPMVPPGHIVIGHANFPSVTTVFPQLSAIIHERKLQTVTLNDVLIRPWRARVRSRGDICRRTCRESLVCPSVAVSSGVRWCRESLRVVAFLCGASLRGSLPPVRRLR